MIRPLAHRIGPDAVRSSSPPCLLLLPGVPAGAPGVAYPVLYPRSQLIVVFFFRTDSETPIAVLLSLPIVLCSGSSLETRFMVACTESGMLAWLTEMGLHNRWNLTQRRVVDFSHCTSAACK